ncbi:glycosyltransferase family 2 protein [Variovorax sp. H27-G14]|uniref:glycosyltransferase family 2 protein n=1 Tax=Variovorax sp. H27-G14 TaxID=3111914 RepID=UPI0038FC976D
MIDSQIDCIVRIHDSSRILELERAIFSLVGQHHRPLRIILATQRFSTHDMAKISEIVAPMLEGQDAPELHIVNWEAATPRDSRTELLNLGLNAATGRYVAFLDYDDTLFPEAYALLLARLRASEAAIAFATVRTVKADVYDDFVRVSDHVEAPFSGKGLLDLFKSNFCPIHSYLIDRKKIPPALLQFDTTLVWEEDYDLLLRICAYARSDFEALPHVIGDYFFKTDNSNSIWSDSTLSEGKLATYEKVSANIEVRRRTTCISGEVQKILFDATPRNQLTIREFLDEYSQ